MYLILQILLVEEEAEGCRLEHLLGCQYSTSIQVKVQTQWEVVTQKWEV